MSSTTPKLRLFKYDPIEDYDIAFNVNRGLNNNWDKIDEAFENFDPEINIDKHAIKGYLDGGEILTDVEGLTDVKYYAHSTFDRSKFTVVGRPIITDDGIASGFSSSNYLTTPIPTALVGNPTKWTMTTKFHFDYVSGTASTQCIFCNEKINSTSGLLSWVTNSANSDVSSVKIRLYNSSNNTIIDIETPYANNVMHKDTTYFVKAEYDNLHFVYSISEDGKNWTNLYNNNISEAPYFESGCNITIGTRTRGLSNYILNSIDLKQFSVKVNGIPVFSGNKTGIDTIKPDDYTVVGSPTISADGIASGFSSGNYIKKDNVNFNYTSSFEIFSPIIKLNSNISTREEMFYIGSSSTFSFDITFVNNNNNITLVIKDNNNSDILRSTKTLSLNTNYQFKATFKDGHYAIYAKENNGNFEQLGIITNSNIYPNNALTLYFGLLGIANQYPFTSGFIDLNAFKIYVDGNLVYQPCLKIPYTESKTGSKIVQSVYRDRVVDVYVQGCPERYYTLSDTDFTLPQGELYGMINQKMNSNVTHITENYHNGASFYRVYSDGFCIQGGTATFPVTVTFLRNFTNTNYIVAISSSSSKYQNVYIREKTNTGFTGSSLVYDSDDRVLDWVAYGYIS